MANGLGLDGIRASQLESTEHEACSHRRRHFWQPCGTNGITHLRAAARGTGCRERQASRTLWHLAHQPRHKMERGSPLATELRELCPRPARASPFLLGNLGQTSATRALLATPRCMHSKEELLCQFWHDWQIMLSKYIQAIMIMLSKYIQAIRGEKRGREHDYKAAW